MLNRVMQEKLLHGKSDDDEEAEEEVEALAWYTELAAWFLKESAIVAFYS